MEKRRDNSARTISFVMLVTLLGKVMGLYRDRLLAVHYGVSMEANAFFTASRIPRVFFDAVFASAIASCFIPVFSEYLEKKGREAARRFAGNFLTTVTLLTVALTALGMLFPQVLVALFADYSDPAVNALAASLTRLMFPTVVFSGVAFSFVGILQAQDHFTAPALMSAASNLIIILYFFFLDETWGIYGLAAAYLTGWLVQGLLQLPPLARLGWRYEPDLNFRSEGMRKVFALMGPVMVSTWVQPINLVVNSRFGSRLYEGAGVAALEYSTNLYLVIAGVLVLSITNVIFPKLSRLTAGGRQADFQDTVRQTLHSTLFLILPMTAGLMAVSRPLVSFLYGDGEFDDFSVQITSSALLWLSLGMAGYAVQNILSRAYFARQEGRAPLIAGAASIGVNILLCALLVGPLRITGLALASAVSSTVYALLLLIPMARSAPGLLDRRLGADMLKMLAAAAVTGLCAAGMLAVLPGVLPGGKTGELISLALCALAGVLVYFLMALLLRLDEARTVLALFRRKT